MYIELTPLLKSFQGQSYKQIRTFMQKGNANYRAMVDWWRLIPQRQRIRIKTRVYTFLFWKGGKFRGWHRFIKLWHKRSPEQRQKILFHWCKKQGIDRRHIILLIVKVIRDGAIRKRIFHYLIEPLSKEQLQRLQLYWWAKLESCCNHAVVIKVGNNDPCLETRFSPDGPLVYF